MIAPPPVAGRARSSHDGERAREPTLSAVTARQLHARRAARRLHPVVRRPQRAGDPGGADPRSSSRSADFQFSLLHGWAFTLFYIVLGVPIGWLADRFSRRWIIIVGVSFWSLMTALCGFARSFGSLFLVRVGVGVGEATLSPAAYSLMSDYFPPERLRWATSVFAMGITLGTGASYMVGGYLYEFFSTRRPVAHCAARGRAAVAGHVHHRGSRRLRRGGAARAGARAAAPAPGRRERRGRALRGGDRAPARGGAPLRRADPAASR